VVRKVIPDPLVLSFGLTAQSLTLTQVSGSNAISLTTGARIMLGNAARYFYENVAQGLTFHEGNFKVNGHFTGVSSVQCETGQFSSVGSAITAILEGRRTNANTNSTTPAITLRSQDVHDAGKALINIQNGTSGTVIARVYADGEIELLVAGKGLIMASPDGTRYRLTIANGGTVSVAAA
jgi:hypothetical protein